jgi:hypothetical protein
MSADGQFGFSQWVMVATRANGPFEMNGMDRTRVRDGLVCENYVFYDPAEFESLTGGGPVAGRAARPAAPARREGVMGGFSRDSRTVPHGGITTHVMEPQRSSPRLKAAAVGRSWLVPDIAVWPGRDPTISWRKGSAVSEGVVR